MKAAIPAGALALAALAACGDPADPCDGYTTCLALTITGSGEIDQVELDLIYGFRLGHLTVPEEPSPTELPVTVPIRLGVPTEPLRVGVVAFGRRDGVVTGHAAGELTVAPSTHAALTLELREAPECTPPGEVYCHGADPTAPGLPDTVYECTADGTAIGHGRCVDTCNAAGDGCNPANAPCVGNGYYCGGDKVPGDPRVLYTCDGSEAPRVCDRGCRVQPELNDDCCIGDAGCGPLEE